MKWRDLLPAMKWRELSPEASKAEQSKKALASQPEWREKPEGEGLYYIHDADQHPGHPYFAEVTLLSNGTPVVWVVGGEGNPLEDFIGPNFRWYGPVDPPAPPKQ